MVTWYLDLPYRDIAGSKWLPCYRRDRAPSGSDVYLELSRSKMLGVSGLK